MFIFLTKTRKAEAACSAREEAWEGQKVKSLVDFVSGPERLEGLGAGARQKKSGSALYVRTEIVKKLVFHGLLH